MEETGRPQAQEVSSGKRERDKRATLRAPDRTRHGSGGLAYPALPCGVLIAAPSQVCPPTAPQSAPDGRISVRTRRAKRRVDVPGPTAPRANDRQPAAWRGGFGKGARPIRVGPIVRHPAGWNAGHMAERHRADRAIPSRMGVGAFQRGRADHRAALRDSPERGAMRIPDDNLPAAGRANGYAVVASKRRTRASVTRNCTRISCSSAGTTVTTCSSNASPHVMARNSRWARKRS
ncbi:hypothetical protein RAS1_10860 [Phycisphaerae bacterium RAS1]|nr:hypothetical protein RAS1_10860 [Phycisphaerae bacterium RAS1]